MVMIQIIYYQYVVKRGKKAKYTTEMKKAIDAIGGEGPGKIFPLTAKCFSPYETQANVNPKGGTDFVGWGDLIWSYPGKGNFKNKNDRTIWGGGKIGPDGLGNINVLA